MSTQGDNYTPTLTGEVVVALCSQFDKKREEVAEEEEEEEEEEKGEELQNK